MKTLLTILTLVFFTSSNLKAQSIRKPWRELTNTERKAYVNAVNTLISNGIWQQFVDDHLSVRNGGFAQHGNDLFLPWHTYFLYYMEQEMGVPLVYWDWEYNQNGLTEWSASRMFDNTSGGNNGLFGENLNSTVANALGRTLNFSPLPDNVVAGLLQNTNFTTFRSDLEGGIHGVGHCQIGGVMCRIAVAPTDPIFYVHHSMVDMVYQEWVDLHWSGNDLFSSTSIGTVTGKSTENPNNHIDSRLLNVWYAKDNLLTIQNFSFSQDQVFKYSTGSIHIEDVNLSSTTDMEVYIKQGSGESVIIEGSFEAPVGSTLKIDTY